MTETKRRRFTIPCDYDDSTDDIDREVSHGAYELGLQKCETETSSGDEGNSGSRVKEDEYSEASEDFEEGKGKEEKDNVQNFYLNTFL